MTDRQTDRHSVTAKTALASHRAVKTGEDYIAFGKYLLVETKVIKVEGKEKEKPVKITREIRFIDSFRFMPTSLDAFIKNLDPRHCKNLKKFYPEPRRKFGLLKRKGVYPCDYVDSVDKLAETALSLKEGFIRDRMMRRLPMKTTNMLKRFGKNLE